MTADSLQVVRSRAGSRPVERSICRGARPLGQWLALIAPIFCIQLTAPCQESASGRADAARPRGMPLAFPLLNGRRRSAATCLPIRVGRPVVMGAPMVLG